MYCTSVNALSERMAAERKKRIGLLLEKEDVNSGALRLRIPGPNLVGRDENGQPFLTKAPECLKMRISKDGHVKIKYRRQESGKIDETFADGMKVPRKQISVSTDLFRGVRSLKHVRKGYERDFEKRDRILGEWRDGEVAQIMAYNMLRECSLRKKRDCELQRLLGEWAEFIEKF